MLAPCLKKISPDQRSVVSGTPSQILKVEQAIQQSWKKIAPFWPLKNLIAVNPLQGFEDLPFENAIQAGAIYFQQPHLPLAMAAINRETIKWCQAFFDDGQATITMPQRELGLYSAWRKLASWDKLLHRDQPQLGQWLKSLPLTPHISILFCLQKLNILPEEWADFLTLLLTTLPGWAAHIKYRTEWSASEKYPVTGADYLAMRLAIICMLWRDASALLSWHKSVQHSATDYKTYLNNMVQNEEAYSQTLLKILPNIAMTSIDIDKADIPLAQLVFCIDVRSEPLRRALEKHRHYETFGFAGFFGLPLRIENTVTGQSHAACPVLITPKHTIKEQSAGTKSAQERDLSGYKNLAALKRIYQALKYNMTTPFVLAETLGLASGLWMGLKSFLPKVAHDLSVNVKHLIRPDQLSIPILDALPEGDQVAYAETALRMIGLIKKFAPLIVLCGHGSTTQNNAYATALDCGACGGYPGATNAKVLAQILNQTIVREKLALKDIIIPSETHFLAAQHNTTTDEVTLYLHEKINSSLLQQLQKDLLLAGQNTSYWRCQQMGHHPISIRAGAAHTQRRSIDWAQIRPEWGLAGNAAFIVAPRLLTRDADLKGRVFLHSYNWQEDEKGLFLTTILTAPMVVAQWINNQYFFSTLDNIAYGSGSKITKNITGKMGIMQGNASDLMHGLPLQSLYLDDKQAYHQPLRLLTLVYAPREKINKIIQTEAVLQKLFGNGWVKLICLEPVDYKFYQLERDFTWRKKE